LAEKAFLYDSEQFAQRKAFGVVEQAVRPAGIEVVEAMAVQWELERGMAVEVRTAVVDRVPSFVLRLPRDSSFSCFQSEV
jgi:hypothetical protein